MRKYLAILVVTLVGAGVSAAPAAAWTPGNVWVNFGSWNCPSGGTVVGIWWEVSGFSSSAAGGDWGDNKIYPRVRVGSGAYNTLTYHLWCKKWGFYTYRAVTAGQRKLTPYRSGLSYTLCFRLVPPASEKKFIHAVLRAVGGVRSGNEPKPVCDRFRADR